MAEVTAKRICVRNASGRVVLVSFGADPDICIQEQFGSDLRNRVAIEIKGGEDISNALNRAGEAEKSHQKAKRRDFREFWTLIPTKGSDTQKLAHGSPTTNSWFDLAQVLAREGPDWEEFRSRLSGEIGIPIQT